MKIDQAPAAAPSRLRALLESGRTLVGGLCGIPSWYSAQIMGQAGFDWMFIDTEHAPVGLEALASMLQALDLTGTPTIVRAAWNRPEVIGAALDLGADGVMVPMINTAEEARAAVQACLYPPLGHRSWGPYRAKLMRPDLTCANGPASPVRAILIETRQAVDNLEAILDVPGIDIIAVGQSDLNISYGFEPTARSSERHLEVLAHILARCTARGIATWINCTDEASAAHWRDRGFRMVSLANDATYLAQGAKAACWRLRQTTPA